MSRSGYVDDWDEDNWHMICWRGAVASAIGGKRGQAFLRETLAALDALPAPRLISHDLETADGEVCALGAVGKRRGMPLGDVDPEDHVTVSDLFGIAGAMAREIVFVNDDSWSGETPEARFTRVRAWVEANLRKADGTP